MEWGGGGCGVGVGIVGGRFTRVEVASTALVRPTPTGDEATPRDMVYIQKESADHIP